MRCFQKMKKQNEFKRTNPTIFHVIPCGTDAIQNNYHSKNTAGGYARNNYGKPYFT